MYPEIMFFFWTVKKKKKKNRFYLVSHVNTGDEWNLAHGPYYGEPLMWKNTIQKWESRNYNYMQKYGRLS